MVLPMGSARRSYRHRHILYSHVLWRAYPEQALRKAYFRRSVFRRILRFPGVHHFAYQMARDFRARGLQLRDVRLQFAIGTIQA